MSNGFKACHKPEIALLNGAKTTTMSGPTAVLGGLFDVKQRITPSQFAQQQRIQFFATDSNNNQFLD